MTDPLDWLAAAVRVSLGSGARLTAPPSLDASALVAAADHHGVLILLDRALGPGAEFEEVRSQLRPLVRSRTERALLLARQLRDLVTLLEADGIDSLPVKGPLLAITAYGDASMRGQSGDLDLVVSPANLSRAVALLETAGYQRVEASQPEDDPAQWLREAHLFPPSASIGTLVELHTDLSCSVATEPLDLGEVMSRSEHRALLGRSFRMESTEDLVLHLALHAAQHTWARMIWTADIAALVRSRTIDWDTLIDRAIAIEAGHRLAVTLRLAVDLFGAAVPDPVRSRLFGNPRVRRTADLALRRMRETSAGVKVAMGFAGVLMRARSELSIRETHAQKARWVAAMLAPAPPDHDAFPLPRALGFLRWALRPLRLLFRHARH